jgi:hypothetical protein
MARERRRGARRGSDPGIRRASGGPRLGEPQPRANRQEREPLVPESGMARDTPRLAALPRTTAVRPLAMDMRQCDSLAVVAYPRLTSDVATIDSGTPRRGATRRHSQSPHRRSHDRGDGRRVDRGVGGPGSPGRRRARLGLLGRGLGMDRRTETEPGPAVRGHRAALLNVESLTSGAWHSLLLITACCRRRGDAARAGSVPGQEGHHAL